MSPKYDIGIFGGDLRQVYMVTSFLSKGFRVATYNTAEVVSDKNCISAESLNDLFDNCSVLIAPVPMSRDQITIQAVSTPSDLSITHITELLKKDHVLIGGNIPSSITKHCDSRNIIYYDLMRDEKITILNAIATAEGTIMEAIRNSDQNLHDSNCLVLGYGRCAKVLAQKLKALDAHVTVAARSMEALAYAKAGGCSTVHISNMKRIIPTFHFIFNTIPSLVLDKECLDLVDPYAAIIDIASAPGGVDFEYARELGLNAKLCLGLPGKVAPKTSADILVNEIITFIKERSD